MSFATRMRAAAASIFGPFVGPLPWIGDRPGVVGPSLAGLVPPTPAAALALTAVYRCCCMLTEAVASAPAGIYAVGPSGGRVQQVGTAPARALATLAFSDAEVFAFGAALTGNGFLRVVRNGTGAPATLIGIPPWRVSMQIDARGSIFYKIAADKTVAEHERVLPLEDVVHLRFRTIGSNRYWGVPPAATCSQALGLALQSRDVQRILFANLSRPGGYLGAPGKIDPKIAKQMRDEWQQSFSGSGTGQTAVLSNGLTYTPLVFNAVDAELLEQVKASVDDVSNCYGIPSNFLSSSSHLTYASSSEATKSLYVSALKTFVARCSDAMSRALLSRDDIAAGTSVEFDLTSTLLTPGAELATFLATLVAGRVITPNEARNLYLNLPDIAGGDVLNPVATPKGAP